MKNIISLLFVSLLTSSLIIGCGSSGGGDGDSGNSGKTVNVPGSSTPSSIDIASSGNTNKPKVTPGCETDSIPGCS